MYKELDKYKTGNKIPIPVIYHYLDGTSIESTYNVDEYKFKFGDLLNDFIIHKNQSWFWKYWHGKYKYNDLTKIYVRWLNLWGLGSDSWM